jgi:hypothetical protein
MPQLNADQLAERKSIIAHFFTAFLRERPWLVKRKQAISHFLLYLDSDPVILRTINGLAASSTPEPR